MYTGDTQIEAIKESTSFSSTLQIIKETFSISKIYLYPKDSTSEKSPDSDESKLPRLEIAYLQDISWINSYDLIYCGKTLIDMYKIFLKNYLNSKENSYFDKKKEFVEAIYQLTNLINEYDISNRFAFITKPVLFVKASNEEEIITDLLSIKLTEEQNNELKELFTIRFELFSELTNLTHNFAQELEMNAFRYSNYKIDKNKGKYILMEFLIALTSDETYIKLNPQETELLEKDLFLFFGLQLTKRGKLFNKILSDRESPAFYLDQFCEILEKKSAHLKKSKKQSIKIDQAE